MKPKAVQRYLNRVAELPCVICGAHGVQLHHFREGQGMGQRAQDWLVIPLCYPCHQGSRGFHGNRAELRSRKLDEVDLLALTIEALNT